MGTNTLNTQVDGTAIESSHVNDYKTALTLDHVPRNSSGIPTTDAGSIGSSVYRWVKGIFGKVSADTHIVGGINEEGTAPDIKNVSNDRYCKHNYKSIGTYTVKLIVSNEAGSDSMSRVHTIV